MSLRTLYVPRVSSIHRLDPRTKIVAWLLIAGPALVYGSVVLSSLMFSLILALSMFGRVASSFTRNIAKVTVPVFIPIILIQGLFYPAGKTPVWILFPGVSFKVEGLAFALLVITRLLAVFGGAYLINLTTYPSDLMASLQKCGLPLRVAYPLFSALQIVPVIESRLQSIKEAQMSRGLKLRGVGIIQRLKNFVPLLTPLLLGAIEEAYKRSIALEARGFSSKIRKTFLRDPKIRLYDILFIALLLVAISIIIFATIQLVPRPNAWNM